MAGVRDELILDISKAQRAIDQLERQISGAVSGVRVELDTSGVGDEIRRAAAAAKATSRLTIDTAGVTPEITNAVNRADTDVRVDVDTTAARREVARLDKSIDGASSSAKGLGIALSGAALLAGGRGLLELAEAASAVNEQLSGSELVFGPLADDVQRFADEADRIGLGEADALRVANAFGQLAQAAGLSSTEVADFATTIVQRGADIASLRDLDLTQTFDALRSGLVGETEPLRNLGIIFNEAEVQAAAFRLGIAEVGDELTDQEKIQTRYKLILEKSDLAQGNFAATAEGLANRQRQVKAELQDLAAEVGGLLAPTFLGLADTTSEDLIPTLRELAEGALPPIGQLLEDLAPVLGTTLEILVDLTPILEVFADVIGAIPTPLIVAGGALLTLNKAQGVVSTGFETISSKARGLSGNLSTMGLRVLQGGPILLGAAIALDTYNRRKQEAIERTRELTGAIEREATGISGEVDAVNLARVIEGDLGAALRGAEANLDLFAGSIRNSGDALDDLESQFSGVFDASGTGDTLRDLQRLLDQTGVSGSALGDELVRLAETGDLSGRELFTLIDRLDEQSDAYDDASVAAANKAAADEAAGIASETAGGQVSGLTDEIAHQDEITKLMTESLDRFTEGLEEAFGDQTIEEAVDRRTQDLVDLASAVEDRARAVEDARRRLADLRADPDTSAEDRAAAERDLQEAIAATSLTLADNSEAALRNRETLRELADDVADVIAKHREEGASLEDLRTIRALEIQNLRDQLTQLGFNSAEIDTYVERLEAIPLTTSTTITVESAEAQLRIKELADSLKALDPGQQLSIDAAIIDRNLQRAAAQQRRLGGEFLPGAVLVGEEGPELRWETRGGFVSTASETRRLLDDIGSMVTLADNLRSRVPQFGLRDQGAARAATIDYERLGDVIARKVAQLRPNVSFSPQVHNPVGVPTETSLSREAQSFKTLVLGPD